MSLQWRVFLEVLFIEVLITLRLGEVIKLLVMLIAWVSGLCLSIGFRVAVEVIELHFIIHL